MPTWWNITMGTDESTYMVFGQELNRGAQLYTDILDLKQPLGLWIFQGFDFLFDGALWINRLILSVIISTSAFLIYKIARLLQASEIAAQSSSVLFIFVMFFHSALTFNFEHFMYFFTLLGIWSYLSISGNLRYFLSGFLLGLAFCIKLLSLLDFFFLLLLMIYDSYKKDGNLTLKLSSIFRSISICVIAFLIPFGLVNFYFFAADSWQAFYFISYEAPGNYSSHLSLLDRLKFVLDFHISYLFYCILFYTALFVKGIPRNIKWLVFIWLICTMLAAQLTGQTFKHYWIQSMPPLCILGGMIMDIDLPGIKKLKSYLASGKYQNRILIGLTFLATVFNYLDYYIEPNPEREMSSFLESQLIDSDQIYGANCCTMIYNWLDKSPVNAFIHPTLFTREVHIRTLDIDVEKELSEIMEMDLNYILIKGTYPIEKFQKYVESNYQMIHQVDDVHLYALQN
jgi:hypothetical protein